MKATIQRLKQSQIEKTVRVYLNIIHPDYVSYGEITEGFAHSTKEFTDKAAGKFKRYIAKSLTRKDVAVFVASVEKNVIGFVCIEIKKAKAGHNEAWISDLGVLEPFRRFGIAKNLMNYAYSFGKKNKSKHFFIESGFSNHGAHALFEKEGFTPLNIVFIK